MLSHQDVTVDHLQAGVENLRVDHGNSNYYYEDQPQPIHADSSDDDDHEPLSMTAGVPLGPSQTHLAQSHLNSSLRPPQFIKPATQAMDTLQDLPADIQSIQAMYSSYSDKTYLEGYMMKMNDLTVDGSSSGDSQWTRWYVELSGPVLTLWDAETTTPDNDQNGPAPVIPQYINLADASVSVMDQGNGVIALNSAGSNRFLLQPLDPYSSSPSSYQAVLWVLAIRLSCFEWSRIHEIYTMNFCTRYHDDVVAATKTVPKMEGFVQVRLAGATEWQKYWVAVSDRRDEKTFFGKKKVPSRGQLHFYDNKKQKHPSFTLVNVGHAYTLYPESPQLIDMATILKVEGSLATTNGGDQEASTNQEPTSALIMVSSRKELTQWLVAIFDSFKLYGRPGKLVDDPLSINSLNFGALTGATNPRVFLEISDIQHANVIQDTYIDNIPIFSGVLLKKMTQDPLPQHPQPSQQQWDHQNDSLPLDNSRSRGQTALPSGQTRKVPVMTPSSSTRGNKLTYASDSEEEEEEDGDDDDDDSDDSDGDNNVLTTLKSGGQQQPSLVDKAPRQQKKQQKGSDDEEDTDDDRSTISESSVPAQSSPAPVTSSRPRRRRIARPQASVSGSGTESDDDDNSDGNRVQQKHGDLGSNYSTDDEHGLIRDAGDNRHPSPMMSMGDPSGQFYGHEQQQPTDGMMYDPVTGLYYGDGPVGLEMGEDGPIIPELGSRFATQNSLLDTYRPDHPSANDQMEYSRQTGHTLLNVPTKPPEPRTGLVGMISQIEVDKKEQKMNKGRVLQMEKDRLLERERERYMWEQRQSMMPQVRAA